MVDLCKITKNTNNQESFIDIKLTLKIEENIAIFLAKFLYPLHNSHTI